MGQISRDLGRSGGGRFVIVFVALVVAVIVAACEEPPTQAPTTAHITGRVTLEGRPMNPGFSVVFMEPQRGDLAYGTSDAEGNFVVNSWKNGEMVPGRYKVYVVPPALKKETDPQGSNILEGSSDNVQLAPYAYDDKYRHLESTPLEYKVSVGENRFEIDLNAQLERPAAAEESTVPVPPHS